MKFESRQMFAKICCTEFGHDNHDQCGTCDGRDLCGECDVSEWVCSEEKHKEGNIHYHVTIKLKRRRRFANVRKYIAETYGINVNFQEFTSQ